MKQNCKFQPKLSQLKYKLKEEYMELVINLKTQKLINNIKFK